MEQTIFDLEKINPTQLPELQGLKEKQLEIVKDNPYIEIVDNETYNEAKKRRTALVKGRTDVEKQDKLIASKIKKFREWTSSVSAELIAITKPHEDKQQEEVKRYEAVKEQERQEKIRLEEERKAKIKQKIEGIFLHESKKVEKLTFEMIDTLKVDWEQNLFKTDVSEFEEFELEFNEKIHLLKQLLSSKENALRIAEAQRIEAERLKAEREALEAQKRQAEEKAQKEREALEIQKREAEEKARKEREALEEERKKLEAQKQAIARAEAERQAKEEAIRKAQEDEERRQREQKEAQERAKAEAERLEALKPDKEKAISFIKSLGFEAEYPNIQDKIISEKLSSIIKHIETEKVNFITFITNLK